MRNPVRLVLGNPVVLKELRGRMRGARAFVVMTAYLFLLGGFTLILYVGETSISTLTTTQVNGGEVGRVLFQGILAIQLILVALIAPAFTAGAISGERERQTYDLLRTTLLPEGQFVMGKLFSALAYIFLLLLAAIPLQSLSFILGGTEWVDMAIATLLLFVLSILLGTLGIYFSARVKRTLSASITTYGVSLVLGVGTLLLWGISRLLSETLVDNGSVSANVERVLLALTWFLSALNPASAFVRTRDFLVNQQSLWWVEERFSGSSLSLTLPSPWLLFVVVYLVVAILFFNLTTRYIKKVDEA
jgi:ABC-type transport system involved in multi-copper enzyme maturation permease subunit